METAKETSIVKKYLKKYFIDAMGAMALGLFASLLIGTIFGTIYNYTHLDFLNTIATYAKAATGMAIGVGGKPAYLYVLYGESISLCLSNTRRIVGSPTAYLSVGSA